MDVDTTQTKWTIFDPFQWWQHCFFTESEKGAKKQEAYKVPLYPKMSSFIFSKIRTRFQIFIAKICRTQINRRSKIGMDKVEVRFFNFHIRWWVGPSTSKNHGVNFPPPFGFRKIKVFDKIFEKILSPGIWPPKLWFAFYQQWHIGTWLSIPHLKDLDPRIPCMCLVMILLSWMLRICK